MSNKLKEKLLADIDRNKQAYLLLTKPLASQFVARRYCSECGAVHDIPLEEFSAFATAMDQSDKLQPGSFFPDYYFETEGCGSCRTADNAPENFFVRNLNYLVMQGEDLRQKVGQN